MQKGEDMQRLTALAMALVLALFAVGTLAGVLSARAFKSATETPTRPAGAQTLPQAPAFELIGTNFIRGTDCSIQANNPHISTSPGTRGKFKAVGKIECRTDKERLWIKLTLKRFSDGSMRTIVENPKNKGLGPENVKNIKAEIVRSCDSKRTRLYQLFVKGTVVKLNGDEHRAKASSKPVQLRCSF